MLHTKRSVGLLIFFFLLVSCSNSVQRSYYPEEITGERVAFYTQSTDLPSNKYILDRDILYVFNQNGTYRSTLDGDLYEIGSYSYQLRKGSNKATLIMQYVDHHKQNQTYIVHMTYESAYAGNWEITYTSKPNQQVKELGTFRFIK